MEKIVMVDGNNLLFRTYYATAYSGNFMQNSKGFPTNALFGFVHMINKIIKEEKPKYMLVAFDIGETFRHKMYDNYKEDRIKMPDDLKKQFPIAKEILTKMGVKTYEIDNYEADDIIGTFSQYCNKDQNYQGIIISSDKDLLQLISEEVEVKLLRQKDFIRYDKETFIQEYEIEPIKIIDLKALQGDASDNIPGVKGIGEKTALKLLKEYGSLTEIYNNLDQITGKTKEKLEADKDQAFLSYELAKIKTDTPVVIKINDIKLKSENKEELTEIFKELEFFSMLEKEEKQTLKTKEISKKSEIPELKKASFYLELSEQNYHRAAVIGMGVYSEDTHYYVKKELVVAALNKIDEKYTFDYKRAYVSLMKLAEYSPLITFDNMIAGYLLNYNSKESVSHFASQFNFNINEKDESFENTVLKAKFIFENQKQLVKEITSENMQELYYDVELKLAKVLGDMELAGINVDINVLKDMGEEIKIKIDLLSEEIYNLAGEKFNIASSQQLAKILFEKLGLEHGKKTKTGYSTAVDVLEKLKGKHAIIDKLLEYRLLTKLHSTYIEGLLATVTEGKIHTIYQQTLTRTGRLSSIEPNLQNIPIRYEYGRLIRKAFVPSQKCVLMAADYSQIELRILAHLAEVPSLIMAFANNEDIHTKTAHDIFQVQVINSKMRRIAKAVNFGIIYGMSEYGLAQNLNISNQEAKEFITRYFQTYPGVKKFMDETIFNAIKDGYVKTLYQRKRNIPELNNSNYMIKKQGERIALNTPIQGTSADILKMAMVKIADKMELEKLKSKMILQVHDELVFDVERDEKKQVIALVKEIMENIVELKVPLRVEIATGDNWYVIK